ncbi:hypothetical protein ACFLRO_00040 [Bacteroidota bacterium]
MTSGRGNLISRKKPFYPVGSQLQDYLERYRRIRPGGIQYSDLSRHDNSVTLFDEFGRDTLWSTVFYRGAEQAEVHSALLETYTMLKSYGDTSAADDLYVDRVDLCLYGNTLPFRIRIVNRVNDNFDYFYVKQLDANRIYGLELEHILSPSRIHYYISDRTMIEEHIIGLPARDFVRRDIPEVRFDRVRLAKEFVKFNERCFVRLLGDMHAGNFVVDVRRDFEKSHYLMRPIDFDQQSHHWRRDVYRPSKYPNNQAFVDIMTEVLTDDNQRQYRNEERAQIRNRIQVSHGRFGALLAVMEDDCISEPTNADQLARQLAEYYRTDAFLQCTSMGELVGVSTRLLLDHNPLS